MRCAAVSSPAGGDSTGGGAGRADADGSCAAALLLERERGREATRQSGRAHPLPSAGIWSPALSLSLALFSLALSSRPGRWSGGWVGRRGGGGVHRVALRAPFCLRSHRLCSLPLLARDRRPVAAPCCLCRSQRGARLWLRRVCRRGRGGGGSEKPRPHAAGRTRGQPHRHATQRDATQRHAALCALRDATHCIALLRCGGCGSALLGSALDGCRAHAPSAARALRSAVTQTHAPADARGREAMRRRHAMPLTPAPGHAPSHAHARTPARTSAHLSSPPLARSLPSPSPLARSLSLPPSSISLLR